MSLPATPSQTIGPFHGTALPFPGGGEAAPVGHPDTITVHGCLSDGDGAPVPEALLEFWQAAPDGSLVGAPGSLRRDGAAFTGFGRVVTRDDGRYTLRTLPPGGAPYLALCLLVPGLTRHLFTRVYLAFPEHDPLIEALPPARRATLLAAPEAGGHRTYRFDIRLRGGAETVFLAFPDRGGRPGPP
ncbi:protocatechuate 3,4-dioxygenase subunit alpha [Streptomyces netropsis]|uniref:Protocatechuate 3,4-dioxygenase alpha subunit n=1 Tax=Streptomyces netropsis TaxID=55404 RepID=A0A7W7LH72_STRNE|nr:protocatechuate 3,4-dioxygenase subunit alpha [Streptomyces netropsis]MBB4889964.1 protocatechuate 3,4-dioxygenase alpha subunit [Streptomyces netropsis]GGR42871.1 protocatechuate 3,4-dioxygenase subunit alpha [Streptomyces netropsis]